MSVQEHPLVKAALAWCNERRAEQNQEPLTELPTGEPMDGHSCPCGKATNLVVGLSTWQTYEDWKREDEFFERAADGDLPHLQPPDTDNNPLPSEVQNFVREFDAGRFPELIEKS